MIFKYFWKTFKDIQKSHWVYIIFMVLSLATLGILENFRLSLDQKMNADSLKILGADLKVSGRRLFTEEEKKELQEVMKGHYVAESFVMSTLSVVTNLENDKTALSLLNGIDSAYPLIGQIVLEHANIYTDSQRKLLESSEGVLISKDLAMQLNLVVGSKIKIGSKILNVLDIVIEDATQRGFVPNMAPPVYLSLQMLKEAGLIQMGSTLSTHYYYLLKDQKSTDELIRKMYSKLKDPAISAQTPRSASEQITNAYSYIVDFLGLVALASVFLGAIGMSYLFKSFLLQRQKDMAILKSMGLDKTLMIKSFLGLFSLLSVIPSLLSIFMIYSSVLFIQSSQIFPQWVNQSVELHPIAMVMVMILGPLVLLMVGLPLILSLSKVEVATLFQENHFLETSMPTSRILWYVPAYFVFWILSVWISHSWVIGSLFCALFLTPFALIMFLGKWMLKALANRIGPNLNSTMGLAWGLGVRLIIRNQEKTLAAFCALGLGSMLILSVSQLETLMLSQLKEDEVVRPSLFLVDIQEEQLEEMKRAFDHGGIKYGNLNPMIRGRLISINGKPFVKEYADTATMTREEEMEYRFKNRGVNLSYRTDPLPSEEIIEGRWFSNDPEKLKNFPEVSVEQRFSKRLGVKLGDHLLFDILGKEIVAQVTSIRRVRWTSFLPNFFIQFSPGVLEEVPKSYIGTLFTDDLKSLQARKILSDQFPNVTPIDLKLAIQKSMEIFEQMKQALMICSILCLLIGLLVLFSILQSQLQDMKQEYLLLKLQNFNSFLKLFFIQFILIAGTSFITGGLFSLIVSKIMAVEFFDGPWAYDAPVFFVFFPLLFLFCLLLSWWGVRKIRNLNPIELLD